jgi:hypothetical protein
LSTEKFQPAKDKAMTTFDARESAFEAKFVHEEDLKFKVRERAVRLLALWAAERLGKSAEAGEAYARDLVAADVADPRPDAAIDRIATDLRAMGINQHEVHQAMDRFSAEASISVRGDRS